MTSKYYGSIPSGGAIGGYLSIAEYQNGVLSREKATLIKNIAADIASTMRIKKDISKLGVNESMDMLRNIVPVPGKSSIVKEGSQQAEICKSLAEAINRRYARAVINTNASAGEICESVSEIILTLFSGVQSEFVDIASDVQRILSNMTIVKNSLESSLNRMKNIMAQSDDPTLSMQSQPIEQLTRELLMEFDRQLAILSNIFNISIDPTTKTIASLTNNNKDLHGLIKSLQGQLGTADMSKKISYLLSGLNNVATVANLVDKALKDIGATVHDYKKSHNTKDLVDRLYEIWQKKNKNPSSEEVAKFIAILDIIKKNDYAHSDILKVLENKSKTEFKKPKKVKRKRGGDGNDITQKYSLSKGIDQQNKVRKILFKDFNNRLETHFGEIMKNVEILSKKIGTTIPINDHLAHFVKVFREIGEEGAWEREDFYLALTGYKEDPVSKDERTRFLGKLDAILNALIPLSKGPNSEQFNAIASSIKSLRDVIDTFQDTYLKSVSKVSLPATTNIALTIGAGRKDQNVFPGDDGDDYDDEVKGGKKHKNIPAHMKESYDLDDSHDTDNDNDNDNKSDDDIDTDQVTTHAVPENEEREDEFVVGAGMFDFSNTFVTLKQMVKHLDFYFKVARTRANLKASAEQNKVYTKKYDSLLGDTVGNMVLLAKKDYNDLYTKWNDKSKDEGKILEDWVERGKKDDIKTIYNQNTMVGCTNDEAYTFRKTTKENMLKLLKEQMNVKIEMYKTIEAIDLYLLYFTDAIATNPNEVKELGQLLKSVDIISKWFNEKSGDNIAQLFESMPFVIDNSSSFINDNIEFDTHYYEWIRSKLSTVPTTTSRYDKSMPANPFLGILPGKMKQREESNYEIIVDKITRALSGVKVLDNIISTFAKLGSKFGGVDLASKVFMNPAVMMKNIKKYMIFSAFVSGWSSAEVNNYKKYFNTDNKVSLSDMKDYSSYHQSTKGFISGVSLNPRISTETFNTDYTAAINNDTKFIVEESYILNKMALALSSIPDASDKPKNGYENTWVMTDKFYIMAIKAMAAKVFTVIGTYGVFNKPLDKYSNLTPVRMVLGGADNNSYPEIIPEAVDAYIELPYLLEFYRESLNFKFDEEYDKDGAFGGNKISMVPDFSGIWSDLFKIGFVDAKYVSDGTYSEQQVQSLINAINPLFKRYKTTVDLINAFVAEVNYRIGVIKQLDIKKYLEEKTTNETLGVYGKTERMNFNLLDEDNIEGRRPAPSDKYELLTPVERKLMPQYDFKLKKLVDKFKEDIDDQVRRLSADSKSVNFDDTIRQYRQQINNAKTNEERYKIVLKSMQGTDSINAVNQYKMLMFHETVVAPLSSLYVLYTIIEKFSTQVQSMNLEDMEKIINKYEFTNTEYKNFETALVSAGKGYEKYLHGGFIPDMGMTYTSEWETKRHTYERSNDKGNENNILVYHGMYGFQPLPSDTKINLTDVNDAKNDWKDGERRTCHLTWGLLTTVAKQYASLVKNEDKKNVKEGVTRFIIDKELLLKDLINLIFSFGTDLGELVNVKVQDKNLLIESGQLTSVVTSLLTQIKKNLEKFRGVINDNVIKRIEGGLVTDVSNDVKRNVGSIYWIEEKLVERLLKENHDTKLSSGFGKLNEILSKTFKKLCSKYNVLARLTLSDGKFVFDKPINGVNDLDKIRHDYEETLLYDSFDFPISELEFWRTSSLGNAEMAGTDTKKINYKDSNFGSKQLLPYDSKKWIYSVIPHIDDLKHEIDSIKEYKTSVELLLQSFKTIMVIINDIIQKNKDIIQQKVMDATKASYLAECKTKLLPEDKSVMAEVKYDNFIVLLKAEIATRTANDEFDDAIISNITNIHNTSLYMPDINEYKLSVPFVVSETIENKNIAGVKVSYTIFEIYELGADFLASNITANFPGFMVDDSKIFEQIYSNKTLKWSELNILFMKAKFPSNFDVNKFESHRKLKEAIDVYNQMFDFIENLKKTSLKMPIPHRVEYYTDPDSEVGQYMLHQNSKNQFDAGLLVRLNEVLAKYLYSGWDSTSKKMYSGIINKFANGTHSQSVLKGFALNDIYNLQSESNYVQFIGLPQQHVTIFASLARFMRNVLLIKKSKTNDPEYKVDSLTDIPPHMKENIRANFPEFDKLFKLIIKKSDLIRQFVQQLSTVRQLGYMDLYGISARDEDGKINGNGDDIDNKNTGEVKSVNANVPVLKYENKDAFHDKKYIPYVHPLKLSKDEWVYGPTGFLVTKVIDSAEWKNMHNLKWYNGPLYYQGAVANTELKANTGTYDEQKTFIAAINTNKLLSVVNNQKRVKLDYKNNMRFSKEETSTYVGFDAFVPLSLEESKKWHTSLLDDISTTASSLQKCVMDTYKELADEPKFLETAESSIMDYTNLNKRSPIMLVSQLQVALRNKYKENITEQGIESEWDPENKSGFARPNFMLPFYKSGEQPFKLQYGSRLVLSRPDVKPTLEFMPGMTSLLDKYNGVSSGNYRFDKADFESFNINHLQILRYLNDVRHYKLTLDSDTINAKRAAYMLYDTPLWIESNTRSSKWSTLNRSYAMKHTLDEVISITETSNQDDSMKAINNSIDQERKHIDNRKDARIYNILNLGIVPFNIAALSRDVPFINIINYEYTFNRMIQDTLMNENGITGNLDEESSNTKLMRPDFEPKTSKGLLCKLLIYPYCELDKSNPNGPEYNGLLNRLLTGDSGLDLGRPKFQGDQMLNKGLLGELYQVSRINKKPDESGSRVDSAQMRLVKKYIANILNIGEIKDADISAALIPFLPKGTNDNYYLSWKNGKVMNASIYEDIIDTLITFLTTNNINLSDDIKTRIKSSGIVRKNIDKYYLDLQKIAYYVSNNMALGKDYDFKAAGAWNFDRSYLKAPVNLMANVAFPIELKANNLNAGIILPPAFSIKQLDNTIEQNVINESKFDNAQFIKLLNGTANDTAIDLIITPMLRDMARELFKANSSSLDYKVLNAEIKKNIKGNELKTIIGYISAKNGGSDLDFNNIDKFANIIINDTNGFYYGRGLDEAKALDNSIIINNFATDTDYNNLIELSKEERFSVLFTYYVISHIIFGKLCSTTGVKFDTITRAELKAGFDREDATATTSMTNSTSLLKHFVDKYQDVNKILKLCKSMSSKVHGNFVWNNLSTKLNPNTASELETVNPNNNTVSGILKSTYLLMVLSILRDFDVNNKLYKNEQNDNYELSDNLRYLALKDKTPEIQEVSLSGTDKLSVGYNVKHDLSIIGRMRFDTIIIRDLLFLTNVQRVMRLIMRDEISMLESPVVNSSSVINRQITEYNSNEVYDPELFNP